MKNLRTAVLALVAVLSLSGLTGLSTASAAKFTAGKVGAALKTTTLRTNEMTLTGSKIQCATAIFTGQTEALESSSQKAVPQYSNCTAFGMSGATINSSGCVYNFTASGEVHIESCTSGGFTVASATAFGKCKMFVKNQSIPNAVTYSNTVGKVDVDVIAEGIHVEVTESTGICPVKLGTHTTGKTSIKVEVAAEGTTIQWDA
jgi:hypothetical protein